MTRILTTLGLCLVFAVAGAFGMFWFGAMQRPAVPDPPALVEKIRDVARLETLDVSLYKKVSFEQPPPWLNPGFMDFLKSMSPFKPKGKAIVFADVHMGLDFSKLNASHLRVRGEAVDVVLPPLQATVELKPGETEVINSNLDSQQTAQLLQDAKEAFHREAMSDPNLQARAKNSAQRSIRALLLSVGFREVQFVDSLQPVQPG